ncbi:pyruvate dehydrogenase (acetyl-transferring) E1 component subunit alpha [Bacillus sp. M6-12]|uniref:pyruvate dehydrogenase (acetyl-transferring) E1 component subunit alpha n=1 Tax=Bacillus sp. M6-12 TaxID=2054166 RepID=UPI000C786369|nr:pyruvate dehydrogenase (acetyl-transferring) E1 component subunit alpha [Bacillus sp. M6-12]PLS15263.1 pyruvate dehydrogenase (acetyl-transferring) E1 component subunit alpha [Bacillus sp. M6-12]
MDYAPRFDMVRVINDDGSIVKGQSVDLDDEELLDLYRKMLFSRILDEKVFRLQRQGRIGTYPPFRGQEAAQVGSATVLEQSDWMFPYGRDLCATLMFGKEIVTALLYFAGHYNGGTVKEGVNIFPYGIMIPPQIPQAVGAAWAFRLRNEKNIALTYFGDGATSKGDFHEGLNIASVFKAPVVFFCQNNQWSISVPFSKQTATPTIAQKSIAYGMPGVLVDGNDILAVRKVTQEAIEHARSGKGPTLIEALTYRVQPHTTADDPTRYQDLTIVEEWKTRDPLERYQKFLETRGIWEKFELERELEEINEEISKAVEEFEKTPKTKLEDIFERVYTEMTEDLRKQKDEVINFSNTAGR